MKRSELKQIIREVIEEGSFVNTNDFISSAKTKFDLIKDKNPLHLTSDERIVKTVYEANKGKFIPLSEDTSPEINSIIENATDLVEQMYPEADLRNLQFFNSDSNTKSGFVQRLGYYWDWDHTRKKLVKKTFNNDNSVWLTNIGKKDHNKLLTIIIHELMHLVQYQYLNEIEFEELKQIMIPMKWKHGVKYNKNMVEILAEIMTFELIGKASQDIPNKEVIPEILSLWDDIQNKTFNGELIEINDEYLNSFINE